MITDSLASLCFSISSQLPNEYANTYTLIAFFEFCVHSNTDKRTAAHIAAAEGNVAAIRVLAEAGANLNLEDRWGNTVQREAERSNARQLLAYLKERKSGEQQGSKSKRGNAFPPSF